MAAALQEEYQRVKQAVIDIGTEWTGPTADKVLALYGESVQAVKKLIGKTTVLKDVRYGKAERNVLDIFLPPADVKFHGQRPVLIYFHGGGFFAGDKNWSEDIYSNIGYYFASHGIITILANYQLVPACEYPAPADDVQKVREWVYNNIKEAQYGSGDPEKVILVGQSAGGAHVATNLYQSGDSTRSSSSSSSSSPSNINGSINQDGKVFPPVKGVAYLSVPFYFDNTKSRRSQTLREYYGSDKIEIWEPKSPIGLFKRIPEGNQALHAFELPVFICLGQLDPKEIVDANVMFFDAYRSKSIPKGTLPTMHVLPGHNHISNVISIGLGENYDIQGPLLLDFIRNVAL